MTTKDLIVAIELGSSKIAGVAGWKKPDGTLQVMAYASAPSTGFIRRGVVYNIDKTAQCLTALIEELETALGKTIINKVYVGLGGYTLRSQRNVVERSFPEETCISSHLVEEMETQNWGTEYPDHDILLTVPQEYKIGNTYQLEPVGINCTHVEGTYLNLIARSSVMQNIAKSFKLAGIEIADDSLSPLIASDVILSETERRQGCALVDLGADTTTVSIYKNNLLRFLVVIPLGSQLITRDLCSLQVEESEAERMKREYGLAVETEENRTVDGNRSVAFRMMHEVIEARFEEIIANVCNQIELSGYADKLLAGVVFTGGAVNMKNVDRYLSQKPLFAKMRVARLTECAVDWSAPQRPDNGTQSTLVGLLMNGDESCCSMRVAEEIKPEDYKKATPGTLFDEEGESAQKKRDEEERARIEREKQEKEVKTPPKNSAAKGFLNRIIHKFGETANELLKDDNE